MAVDCRGEGLRLDLLWRRGPASGPMGAIQEISEQVSGAKYPVPQVGVSNI